MGFLRRVWSSVTDTSSYADIIYQRVGRSLAYLVLLVTLTSAVSAVRGAVAFVAFYRELERQLVAGMPGFSLAGGVLNWEGPEPYVIHSRGGSLIVDTTGATTIEGLGPYWQGILVGRDRLWACQGGEVTVLPYRDVGLDVNRDKVLGWLPYLKPLAVVAGILGYGVTLAAKMLSTTAAAGLVALLAGFRGRPLPFFAAWNLAAHAVTLPLLLTFGRGQLGIGLALGGQLLLYYGLVLTYAYLALRWPTDRPATAPPPPAGVL
ncbi:MAG: DUF1189 domain-containing protein [bacterium]|nr:DUF1189 domain-containing protein [bacterium]